MKIRLLHHSCLSIALLGALAALPGCGDDKRGTETEATTGTTEATTEVDTSTSSSGTTDDSGSGSTTTTGTTADETTGTSGGPTTTGNPNGAANGEECSSDAECMSGNCYVVPLLGGQCGECNEDADCALGGCTPPNPFETNGSTCNMGEPGGGCESDEVCMDGLTCSTVLDIAGLIQINTCSNCQSDADCGNQICAPVVDVQGFSGLNDCIDANTIPQDGYCDLEGNGDAACASGICSTIDIMGITEIGACGECNSDADCNGGACVEGVFDLNTAELAGSTCQ